MNHCNLTFEATEWLNGELLGDGSLTIPSLGSACFSYSSTYLEYAQYVSSTLKSFGIEQVGKILKYTYKYTFYRYTSRAYSELFLLCYMWYPKGKKIVPKFIKLSPVTCRQWYIGDRCLQHTQAGSPRIVISTQSFLKKDVEWLVKQLWEIGILATRQPVKNVISVSTYSTKDFLDYIGECPVECYKYKWKRR